MKGDATEYVVQRRWCKDIDAGPFAVLDTAINEAAKKSRKLGIIYTVVERGGRGASRIRAFSTIRGAIEWAKPCKACGLKGGKSAFCERCSGLGFESESGIL